MLSLQSRHCCRHAEKRQKRARCGSRETSSEARSPRSGSHVETREGEMRGAGAYFRREPQGGFPAGWVRGYGGGKSQDGGFLSGWGWCHFPKCGKSQSRGAQRLWSSGVLTRPGDERVGSTVCPRQGRCRWKAETGILVRVNAMQHVR